MAIEMLSTASSVSASAAHGTPPGSWSSDCAYRVTWRTMVKHWSVSI